MEPIFSPEVGADDGLGINCIAGESVPKRQRSIAKRLF